jgi:SAM-dependent methyltransferase/uncharacterized protein YbaR (Trm112 family)
MDQWFLENLVCPVDRSQLHLSQDHLVSEAGRMYPVVDGIPVMLLPDADPTLWVGPASIRRARGELIDKQYPEFYLDTIGVSDEERAGISEMITTGSSEIDPVVMFIISQTNGYAYKHLIGKLNTYPIPDPPLPCGKGQSLLDIGCNWGRWCLAAARKGYNPVGIDPSLGAVMAARRVAKQMNLNVRHLVADARYLPFKQGLFETVFSNGVIQHFSRENALLAFSEASRVLKHGGACLIQMANFLGARSLQHQAHRGFREGRNFEVRYWSVPELKRTFRRFFGEVSITPDCYFGLGLQQTDRGLMPSHVKAIFALSEGLRLLSKRVKIIKYIADSVYVSGKKIKTGESCGVA